MSTTVGASLGVYMLGHNLFTSLFEHARDARPRVAGVDESPTGITDATATSGITQECDDGAGKRIGIVRGDVMTSGPDPETFRTNRRRDDRTCHRQRLENLQARAAARSQRHDVDFALRN